MGQPLEHLGPVLFESARDPLFLLNPDNEQVLNANPAALAVTGGQESALVGIAASELFRSEAGTALADDFFGNALSAGRAFSGRLLLRGRQADEWVPVQADVSLFPAGSQLWGLVRARDERAERQAEMLLRALIDSIPDLI